MIVGAAATYGREVIFLVDEFTAPYAIALDRSTGAVVWKSAPFAPPLSSSAAQAGSYTNASPIIAGGLVVAGYSPSEGDPTASAGFSLIDAATGRVVKTTPTIAQARQAQGYAVTLTVTWTATTLHLDGLGDFPITDETKTFTTAQEVTAHEAHAVLVSGG